MASATRRGIGLSCALSAAARKLGTAKPAVFVALQHHSFPRAPTACVLGANLRALHAALDASGGGGGGGHGWDGTSGGGGHGWDGTSNRSSTAWHVLVPAAAGLGWAIAGQGAAEARCDGAAEASLEDLKIASMSANKASGKQSSVMAKIEAYGTMVLPYVNMAIDAIDVIAPIVVKAWQIGRAIYNALPLTIIEALGGFAMCFFGGMYPLTVAAAQTFQVSGGDVALRCLEDIWEELVTVYEANRTDNSRDDDGDGTADVNQVSSKDLLSRKVALVLKVCPKRRWQPACAGSKPPPAVRFGCLHGSGAGGTPPAFWVPCKHPKRVAPRGAARGRCSDTSVFKGCNPGVRKVVCFILMLVSQNLFAATSCPVARVPV